MNATEYFKEHYKHPEIQMVSKESAIHFAEGYAKHVIEIMFCDGSPIDFDQLTIEQLKNIHNNINICVDWVNSNEKPLTTNPH